MAGVTMSTVKWPGLVSFSILVAVLASSVSAATPSRDVKASLSRIKSVAGGSVLARIQACGITFAAGSDAETATSDYPDLPARKGDLILDVYINVPRLADQNPDAYRGLLARWVISHGVAHPISGWAQWLQDKPVPIGSMDWMNC